MRELNGEIWQIAQARRLQPAEVLACIDVASSSDVRIGNVKDQLPMKTHEQNAPAKTSNAVRVPIFIDHLEAKKVTRPLRKKD
jgi:hypothetical protein